MINLNEEELEMLSECILYKMKEISSIKPISPALSIAIQSELEILQNLNSVICVEMEKIQENSNNTK